MATWSTDKRLATLKAQKKGNVLVFQAGKEKAEVHLKGGDIQKVVYSHGKDKTTIANRGKHHIVVGENNWERDVYHYLKPGGPAPMMRLGITKHRGKATWSSLPHDFELNTERGFEEIFFYILEGGPKKAIQVGKGVWFDNKKVDSVWLVENETFGVVPMGYHPVAGLPEVTVSYVWVYLAKKKSWEKVKPVRGSHKA